MNWLYYLAEANIYLGVFYLAYCLFLNKETYYQLNRAYLIFSCIASFVLPVLQIGALKPVETAVAATVTYAAAPMQPTQVTFAETAPVVMEHQLNLQDYLWYIYLVGAAVLLLTLIIKLYTLFKLMHNKQSVKHGNHKMVYLPETDVAFSFFNYLFIGAKADGAGTIIRHELVHIRQKHSLDIIFLEILKVINWFNPFVYLLQNSLKAVHEYIADEQTAVHETDALTYSSFLVNNAYGAGGSSITHSFFNYNLLKKRIIRLNQERSGNMARLKYLVTVPVCMALLCASTLAFSKTYGWVDLAPPLQSASRMAALKPPGDRRPILPPPVFQKSGYESLVHHLYKNINYKPAPNDKGGIVKIGFTVDGYHTLSNIKTIKSAGSALDALAINAFKTYHLPINDKPGIYKYNVVFYNTDYSIFKNMNQSEQGLTGTTVMMNTPRVYQTTAKGYEYEEHAWYDKDNKMHLDGITFYKKDGEAKTFDAAPVSAEKIKLLKNKYGYTFPKGAIPPSPPTLPTSIKDKPVIKTTSKGYRYEESGYLINNKTTEYRVIIHEKNGDETAFLRNKATAAQIKLLKDKYDYTFPVAIIYNRLPPDAPKPQIDAVKFPKPIILSSEESFKKYISKNIKYPPQARDKGTMGNVIVTFTIADNKITNVQVVKDLVDGISEEAARVIQNGKTFGMQPGNYVIPIFFTVVSDTPVIHIDEPPTNHPAYIAAKNAGATLLNEVSVFAYAKPDKQPK